MTEDRMALIEAIQKADDGNFLRVLAETVLQIIMDADVEALVGAGRHERADGRLTYRNGYRDRTLETRLGAAVTFVRVKGLFIKAASANTNNVVIGAATSNQWATLLNTTGTLTLRPGASLAVVAGGADATAYAVTASTGDLLKVASSAAGSSVSYDICIIGASA